MDTRLTVRARLEQHDLFGKLKELARLQSELIDRELFLTNLHAEFCAFEIRYMREVGALYLKLDEWNVKITQKHVEGLCLDGARIQKELAELLGNQGADPITSHPRSSTEWFGSGRKPNCTFVLGDEPDSEPAEFHSSVELKSAYREVAKRVHPDLATNIRDRQRREALMRKANSAFQQGDLEALKSIVEEYEQDAEQVSGIDGIMSSERIERQILQIKVRLKRIEQEIASLLASDTGNLKQRADAAWARGYDLLADMAAGIRKQIDDARERFYSVSGMESAK